MENTLFDMSKHPFSVGDLARVQSAPAFFAKRGQVVEVTHIGRSGDVPCVTVRNVDTLESIRCAARMIKLERRAIFTSQSACGDGRYVCGPESQSDRVLASAINMRDKIAQAVDCEPASLEIEIDTTGDEFSCYFDLSAFDLDAVTVDYNAALNAWAVEHAAQVVD